MEIKYIVYSMMVILPLLFIFAGIFRKKETVSEQLEARYFELIQDYQANPSDLLVQEMRSVVASMRNQKGMTEKDIIEKVEKDLSIVSSTQA
ncbi:MAG: hypothetical protein KC493_12855 [Bacteriovoracaceae bacterium]|nr:hypothetical protein [Bacteriovoracaceae bacterium]